MADKYRFRSPVDKVFTLPDGTEVPRRYSTIVREEPDGSWKVVGFVEARLRKIKRAGTGTADLMVLFSGTIEDNPFPATEPKVPQAEPATEA